MNDIERARTLRDERAWVERADHVKAAAAVVILGLPPEMTWSDRIMTMMVAILGCIDTLDMDRASATEAFGKLAAEVKKLEIVGLKELFGE